MDKTYDFSGWASRNDIECSDGRTIRRDAFKNQHGQTVPLVWNHDHKDAYNVLGHALLENRAEGVYAYGSFNSTEQGQNAKEMVKHGDITSLSIYANKLKQKGGDVVHGCIREVSLVLAGANRGAVIETVVTHSDGEEEEATVFNPSEGLTINHSGVTAQLIELKEPEKKVEEPLKTDEKNKQEEVIKMAEGTTTPAAPTEKTVQDVLDGMTEEQRNVCFAMVAMALDENNKEGDGTMKQNAFDQDGVEKDKDGVLTHAEILEIIEEAKKGGSLKEACLAHSIENIDVLYPEARLVGAVPNVVTEDTAWVTTVMGGVKKSPFSRIKTIDIDITADNARAKGYVKGNQKVEEVIKAAKRNTTPTTVYKLQKLDRDDVIDITDFDVVSFIKTEMRGKLNEELARAFLLGDGRDASDNDKINEGNIRPILGDNPLYTIAEVIEKTAGQTNSDFAVAFIESIIRSRKKYKGSGNPTLFTTEDMLTEMLLVKDTQGRYIYESVEKLRTTLRVRDIVTVPPMEKAVRTDDADEFDYSCLGILVNLTDYTSGATRGGEVSFFDDFDLNFNKYEYLIETRCSGALTKPYSAISFELKAAHTQG